MEPIQTIHPELEIPATLEMENLIWQRGFRQVAGIDEAGCGPLAGPVVAAAVVFPPNIYIPGVRDSKKLNAEKREYFYDLICDAAVSYGIGVVSHGEIDEINIRQATFKAMRMALGQLQVKPDYVLFDGYELPEKLFLQEAIIDGDNHSFTIAAASILAKVTRDRIMVDYHREYPLYGFDRHKGYGTALHRESLKKHGPCRIHRKTFLRKIIVK